MERASSGATLALGRQTGGELTTNQQRAQSGDAAAI